VIHQSFFELTMKINCQNMLKLPTVFLRLHKVSIKSALVLLAILLFISVDAQKKAPVKKQLIRCGTMEALANDIKNDPALRERIRQGEADYQQSLLYKPAPGNTAAKPLALPGPVARRMVAQLTGPAR